MAIIPTWDESTPVDAAVPTWDESTPVGVQGAPVEDVSAPVPVESEPIPPEEMLDNPLEYIGRNDRFRLIKTMSAEDRFAQNDEQLRKKYPKLFEPMPLEREPMTVAEPEYIPTVKLPVKKTEEILSEPEYIEKTPIDIAKESATEILNPFYSAGLSLIGNIGRKTLALVDIENQIPGLKIGKALKNKAFETAWNLFPETMQAIQEKRNQTTTPIEQLKVNQFVNKAIEPISDFLEEVDKTHEQVRKELKQEGGAPTDVIMSASEGLLNLALDLTILGKTSGGMPGKFTKEAENVFKNTAIQSAKVFPVIYATTEGTPQERAESALTTTAYMMTPAIASQVPNDYIAKVVNLALNSGLSTLSGSYRNAIQEAKLRAESDGVSYEENKIKYLAATITPQAIMDIIFSVGTKSARQGNVDAIDLIRNPLTKNLANNTRYAQQIEETIKSQEPLAIEPTPAEAAGFVPRGTELTQPITGKEISNAIENRPKPVGGEPERRGINEPRLPADAGGGNRPQEGGAIEARPDQGLGEKPPVREIEPILPPSTPPSQKKQVQGVKPITPQGVETGALLSEEKPVVTQKQIESDIQKQPITELSDKELIVKPLKEITEIATKRGIDISQKNRQQIIEEIKSNQNELQKEKILNELPIPEEMKRQKGLRNIAGSIGFEKQIKVEPTPQKSEATEVQSVFDKQRSDVEQKYKKTLNKIRDEVSSNLMGTDIPFTRRLMESNGKDVVIAKVLSRGWGTKTEIEYEDALNDIKDTIPHRLSDAFNDFIQARRTIEVSNLMRESRGKQPELFAEGELPEVIKSPGGKGAKENREWINEFKRQHPKEFSAMEIAAKKWDATMAKVVDEYFESGLIDKEYHDYLIKNHKNFSPRRFIQHIDPVKTVQIGGNKLSIPDSGIEALDVGSEKSLINDTDFLLSEVLSRKNSRIAKNNANKELYKYVQENKDNPFGLKIETESESEKTISPELSRISVMIDGKPKTMVGNTDLIKYWIDSSPELNSQTAKVISNILGVKLVKALATGYNPAFALYNIPRDLQHYWFVANAYGGTGYSKHAPIAAGQILKDVIKVLPDTIMRRGRYADFVNEGGGLGFLATQGRLGRSKYGYSTIHNEAMRQIEKTAGWLGETSEILSRLAIREREISSGKSSKEATYISRQVLDFAQGGKVIKTMDNFVPYLNAAVQGTRGVLDAWRKNPGLALYKTAQIISLGALFEILRNKTNEKTSDAIPDSEQVSKFVFPLAYYKIDKNGNKRYFYIPVPKDQSQQIFSVIGQELARKAMGKDVSFHRIRMALSNFLPTDTSNLPPLISALLSYILNKDLWTNDDIWKGREVSPSKEFYPTTPEGWKKIGEITGLSPERLQKSAGRMIPNNPFINLFGGVQSPIEYSKDDDIMQKMFTLINKTPVISRYLKVTPSVDLTENEIKKAEKYDIEIKYPDGDIKPKHLIRSLIKEKETEINDLRQLADYKMDIMVGQIKRNEINKNELSEWVGSQEDEEEERLNRRLKLKYPKLYHE